MNLTPGTHEQIRLEFPQWNTPAILLSVISSEIPHEYPWENPLEIPSANFHGIFSGKSLQDFYRKSFKSSPTNPQGIPPSENLPIPKWMNSFWKFIRDSSRKTLWIPSLAISEVLPEDS